LPHFSLPVAAETINGKVIGIVDGDTIDVLDPGKITHRIRLAGIGAPEKSQAFGSRSTEHLSSEVPPVFRLPKDEFYATSFSCCCSLRHSSMNRVGDR
jgi:endonuclease YncB( thermonuclease family)